MHNLAKNALAALTHRAKLDFQFVSHVKNPILRLRNQHQNLQVQQTPKPLAQVPALVPPLAEHSSLYVKKYVRLFL